MMNQFYEASTSHCINNMPWEETRKYETNEVETECYNDVLFVETLKIKEAEATALQSIDAQNENLEAKNLQIDFQKKLISKFKKEILEDDEHKDCLEHNRQQLRKNITDFRTMSKELSDFHHEINDVLNTCEQDMKSFEEILIDEVELHSQEDKYEGTVLEIEQKKLEMMEKIHNLTAIHNHDIIQKNKELKENKEMYRKYVNFENETLQLKLEIAELNSKHVQLQERKECLDNEKKLHLIKTIEFMEKFRATLDQQNINLKEAEVEIKQFKEGIKEDQRKLVMEESKIKENEFVASVLQECSELALKIKENDKHTSYIQTDIEILSGDNDGDELAAVGHEKEEIQQICEIIQHLEGERNSVIMASQETESDIELAQTLIKEIELKKSNNDSSNNDVQKLKKAIEKLENSLSIEKQETQNAVDIYKNKNKNVDERIKLCKELKETVSKKQTGETKRKGDIKSAKLKVEFKSAARTSKIMRLRKELDEAKKPVKELPTKPVIKPLPRKRKPFDEMSDSSIEGVSAFEFFSKTKKSKK